MVDMYPDPDENDEIEETERELDLEEGRAPDPVGVYDRPERTGISTSLIVGIVAIVLLLVVAFYVFQFLI